MLLHEAMAAVLRDAGGPLTAEELSARVTRQGLYRKRDGGTAQPSQIRLRARNYGDLFVFVDERPQRIWLSGVGQSGAAGSASRPLAIAAHDPGARKEAGQPHSRDVREPGSRRGGRTSEMLFFAAVGRVLPEGTLRYGQGAVAGHLARQGLRLSNHHWGKGLPGQVDRAMDKLLSDLHGDRHNWAERDLTPYIDGFAAPPLGPCLIEFDEEQHFSPCRMAVISTLADSVELGFDAAEHKSICMDEAAFTTFLRKSRLSQWRSAFRSLPTDAESFLRLLSEQLQGEELSGYVGPKPGFPFVGGRIAQRAYYDSLRDCFHVTRIGRSVGLRPTIRIAKRTVERMLGQPIERAGDRDLTQVVRELLRRARPGASL